MQTDSLGIPIYSKTDILDIIYQGKVDLLSNILVDLDQSELERFNSAAQEAGESPLQSYTPLSINLNDFDQSLQSDWLMPDEYRQLDIESFLVNECPKENYQRLVEELQEYRSRNMLNLLRWLKYFVDTCRANNVLWGVGRGSSVASYALYLIGVHKIDSLKYNLDWREFLR
jgi:DNA polymerase III alpha subunit